MIDARIIHQELNLNIYYSGWINEIIRVLRSEKGKDYIIKGIDKIFLSRETAEFLRERG